MNKLSTKTIMVGSFILISALIYFLQQADRQSESRSKEEDQLFSLLKGPEPRRDNDPNSHFFTNIKNANGSESSFDIKIIKSGGSNYMLEFFLNDSYYSSFEVKYESSSEVDYGSNVKGALYRYEPVKYSLLDGIRVINVTTNGKLSDFAENGEEYSSRLLLVGLDGTTLEYKLEN